MNNEITKSWLIPIYSGILEHWTTIGPAIWLFLLFIDKTTEEKNGKGLVLGGMPVTYELFDKEYEKKYGKEFPIGRRQYGRYIKILRDNGYIHTTKTARGLIIVIHKSKKFKTRGKDKKVAASPTAKTDMSSCSDTSVAKGKTDMAELYIDNTVDSTKTKNDIWFIWNEVREIFNLPPQAVSQYQKDILDTINRIGFDTAKDAIKLFIKDTYNHPPVGKIKNVVDLFHWKKIDDYLSELPKPRDFYYITCLKCKKSKSVPKSVTRDIDELLNDPKMFCCGQKRNDTTNIVVDAYAIGMDKSQIRVVIKKHIQTVIDAGSELGGDNENPSN